MSQERSREAGQRRGQTAGVPAAVAIPRTEGGARVGWTEAMVTAEGSARTEQLEEEEQLAWWPEVA